MTRGSQERNTRGYFAIGICNGKAAVNQGTLWRSAYQLGAAYVFTVGKRYKKQSSDTTKTWRHVPMFNWQTFVDLLENRPMDCVLVGIEMGGKPLPEFKHPDRAIYLLGAEDHGLPKEILDRCNFVVSIPAVGPESYNVSVAGSIVMYDRHSKRTLDNHKDSVLE